MSDVARLQAALSGSVLESTDPGFETALTIDNGRVALVPAYVVLPRSAGDVALALRFARDRDLPLTVKSGGHSAAGYCLNRGGVVLDLSLMKEIELDRDARTVRVQLGARWEDVYGFLVDSGTGLIPVGGGCLTVGLGGFLLGGGYSFVSRSYGLGCDNVISIDLVTPDGVLHHLHEGATSPEDRDLWWACRGGGGGNFGVAVAVELAVHRPAAPSMLVGEVSYPLASAHDVIGTYNEWVQTVPAELAVYGYLGDVPDPVETGRKRKAFRITAVYNGAYGDGVDLLGPMLRLPPISSEFYALPLPLFEDKIGTSTLVGDRQGYIRSGIIPVGAMTPPVVDIYRHFIDDAPSPDSFVVWTHGGGAISTVAGDATAYPHRAPGFIYELKAIWTDAVDTRTNVEWAYGFGEALRPHFSGAYANYIDPLLTDWPEMYYGDNYERLVRIKRAVDPGGLFDFQQGIGSTFRPGRAEPLDLSPLNRTQLVSGEA
ncbi:MAG: FAD-binding oxidoreductase [Acidimicrobiales bacterium]|jgi:FAD/FMN-containing dehydrogenase